MAHYVYHNVEALSLVENNPFFIIDIIGDPCPSAILTIDPSILSATTIDYEITATTPHTEIFDLTAPKVTSSESSIMCPHPYSSNVVNMDNSLIDATVFTW